MAKFQYLQKRDDRGVMLRYSAHELSYDVSHNALDFINTTEVYDALIKVMPQQYVNLYYLKMLHEAFSPIAHQLVIYKHDKQHCGKVPLSTINANSFPCETLLREIWPEKSVDFSYTFLNQKKNNAKEVVKQLLKGKNFSKYLFHPLNNRSKYFEPLDLQLVKIAVNYQEGFDNKNRSDIFWLKDSGIDPKNVIVYYDNPHNMVCYDGEKTSQEFFDELGIKQLKLWEWQDTEIKANCEKIKLELESIQKSDKIEKWMKKTAVSFCRRVSYWTSFFKQNGIKIHFDSSEAGLETIIKQIALHNTGGLSIGRERSYPPNLNGTFLGYYPNNIFFSWGNDSTSRLKKSNAHIKNILISGFPYFSKLLDQNDKSDSMEPRIKLRNTKFNILLLDAGHGSNEELNQGIPSEKMALFYQLILDWVREDKDIGVVIKPKKTFVFDRLVDTVSQVHDLEQQTDRCYLVKDSFQKMPSTYLNGIDMVIGVSCFISAAVIECALKGARAVFYDYANLLHHEPDLYSWGENLVMFPDLEIMVDALKAFKNNPSSNQLGDWSEHLDDLDPFRDDRGGERIGTYMRWLQEGFDEDLDRNKTIDRANEKYGSTWGSDKIMFLDQCKK